MEVVIGKNLLCIPRFSSSPPIQMLMDAMDGKPHDIEVRTYNFFNSNHSDPVLRAISSRFIKWFVMIDVVFNLLWRECF